MKVSVGFSCNEITADCADCVIFPLTQESWSTLSSVDFPWLDSTVLARIANDGEFEGKFKQTLLIHGDDRCPRLLFVGLGEEEKRTAKHYRAVGALAAQQLRQRKLTKWAFDLHSIGAQDVSTLVDWLWDGVLLEIYRFDRYQSAEESEPKSCAIQCSFNGVGDDDVSVVEQALHQRETISRGVWLARDLVNEPSNIKTPEYLAKTAWDLAQQLDLTFTVLGQRELERQGFGALLAVAQGSICEPRLIVLDYQGGEEGEQPVALVGKGVTFDSGGISLKPGEGMDQMKMDMAGGATVLATMATIARLELPINVIGVVPAVENMPSDRATRPGDIVTSLSGKTIEILNTDAEGRLILADALTWVKQKDPQLIVDLATLTGACILALGHHASAVLGNDEDLLAELQQAGECVDERLWPLPLFEEYIEQIKSSVADVKNIGGRPAGTITAAAFLQKFVDDTPWAHIDIAGTAWEEKGRAGQPTGGTGYGVRLLAEYLQQRC